MTAYPKGATAGGSKRGAMDGRRSGDNMTQRLNKKAASTTTNGAGPNRSAAEGHSRAPWPHRAGQRAKGRRRWGGRIVAVQGPVGVGVWVSGQMGIWVYMARGVLMCVMST